MNNSEIKNRINQQIDLFFQTEGKIKLVELRNNILATLLTLKYSEENLPLLNKSLNLWIFDTDCYISNISDSTLKSIVKTDFLQVLAMVDLSE